MGYYKGAINRTSQKVIIKKMEYSLMHLDDLITLMGGKSTGDTNICLEKN